MKRPLPTLTSDEDAERFVDEADLSDYDLSKLQPTRFEFAGPTPVRLKPDVLELATRSAAARSLPLADYLGEVIERALAREPA